MKSFKLEIEGIKCGSCVTKIKQHFLKVIDVKNIDIDPNEQTVDIVASDSFSIMKIRNEMIELGFEVNKMSKL